MLLNDKDAGPSSGQGCIDHCLSRGGRPEVCNDQCGEVHDEGVFYDPGYDPRQLPPVRQQEESPDFSGVQYDCFRECRLHGDDFRNCAALCTAR